MPQKLVLFPDDLKAGLEALKARDGIAESEAIRRAVAEYLVRKGILTPRKKDK
jgi:Ribbon-helix-helix protein, copG family